MTTVRTIVFRGQDARLYCRHSIDQNTGLRLIDDWWMLLGGDAQVYSFYSFTAEEEDEILQEIGTWRLDS